MKLPASKDEFVNLILELKDNMIAVLVVAAVVFLLDIGIVLRGQFISLSAMFKESKQLKSSIVTSNEDSKFSSKYEGKIENFKLELENLNKMIISEGNLPVVLESISKFADISAVRVLVIKPAGSSGELKPASKATGQQEILFRQKINIDVKAGFHQLGRFVALLESSPIFLDVVSIDIRADQSDYAKQLVALTVEAVLRK